MISDLSRETQEAIMSHAVVIGGEKKPKSFFQSVENYKTNKNHICKYCGSVIPAVTLCTAERTAEGLEVNLIPNKPCCGDSCIEQAGMFVYLKDAETPKVPETIYWRFFKGQDHVIRLCA